MTVRILVIDNYDSFVFNLVQYLGQLGAECEVRRNDEISVDDVGTFGAAGLLLSPGPGSPERAGIMLDVIRAYAGKLPMFGVCLGHQAIGAAFGATVDRAPELLHGKTSQVHHTGAGVLAGLPDPFTATRYHSLAVRPETLPAEIEVTGSTESGVVMAMRHRHLPIEGVQFHPESVLTEGGHTMLANWLASCGLPSALEKAPALAAEVESRRRAAFASA
jgi:para-aminobenzoate synthetase component 2